MKWSSIPKVSSKRRRQQKARTACVKAVLERDGYRCRIKAPGCKGTATTAHEPLTRARGGDPTDPEQCIASCDSCNNYVSNVNPKWAELHGFLKSQFVMGKHEARQTPTVSEYLRQVEDLQRR